MYQSQSVKPYVAGRTVGQAATMPTWMNLLLWTGGGALLGWLISMLLAGNAWMWALIGGAVGAGSSFLMGA